MNVIVKQEDLLRRVLLRGDVVDLGTEVDDQLSGIFSPADEVESIPLGVTAQFLENPGDFHHNNPDTAHAEWLIRNALERISAIPTNPLVLDVGSGSGNTAFALLRALQNPTVIATDISRPLLRETRQNSLSLQNADRVVPLCIDLNKPSFKDNKFDLIVGRAILHHLFEPDVLIRNLYGSLKPGASMVFFEPNESGYAVFHMLLEQILETSHRLQGLSEEVKQFLRNTIAEYQNCTPKPVDEYADIDDKWNFSRTYFEELADDLNAKLRVYPLYPSDSPYSGELTWRLKAAINADPDAIPDWGWEIIRRWEARLSPAARNEMTCAISIIITKPNDRSTAGYLSRCLRAFSLWIGR